MCVSAGVAAALQFCDRGYLRASETALARASAAMTSTNAASSMASNIVRL
jgi:hypothetical protein